RYVKRKYGWTVVLTQGAVFGLMAGSIIVVFYVLRRKRDRTKLAELRATELPDAPAYWSEGGIEIIAHRGYSARAPENTIAALELAVEYGATAIEFDVRTSADGVPVVIHDDSVERTTNGRGKVARLRLADLQKLDAGSWFGRAYAGEPIPTLEEVLIVMAGRMDRIYIELKERSFKPAVLDGIVDMIDRFGMTEQCVIMSFDWSYLEHVGTRSAFITTAYLVDNENRFLQALQRAQADGRALVDCNYRILLKAPELTRRAENMDIELAVYTVNDPTVASVLARHGIFRITTNEVEKLIRWAAGRSAEDERA
ncbi:MAG: glycerophosphodiester phosphodiesterase, partial [Longimicrobiales bacterium]